MVQISEPERLVRVRARRESVRILRIQTGLSSITLARKMGMIFSLLMLCGLIKPANARTSSDTLKHLMVTSSADQKVSNGLPSLFSGSVRVQSLFGVLLPGRSTGGLVTFQPGARSHWHTHPLGQVLIVTDGEGWVQEWGKPRQLIRKGDVVQIPADVKHWHGATATSAMTHIAIQEMSDGRNVDWLEPVTNSQYADTK